MLCFINVLSCILPIFYGMRAKGKRSLIITWHLLFSRLYKHSISLFIAACNSFLVLLVGSPCLQLLLFYTSNTELIFHFPFRSSICCVEDLNDMKCNEVNNNLKGCNEVNNNLKGTYGMGICSYHILLPFSCISDEVIATLYGNYG